MRALASQPVQWATDQPTPNRISPSLQRWAVRWGEPTHAERSRVCPPTDGGSNSERRLLQREDIDFELSKHAAFQVAAKTLRAQFRKCLPAQRSRTFICTMPIEGVSPARPFALEAHFTLVSDGRNADLLEKLAVDESYFLQAAVLQVRQSLRHDFVAGEFVHCYLHFGLRRFQCIRTDKPLHRSAVHYRLIP